MKTNDEIRRDNLLIAISRFGTASALAKEVDTAAAYLSQIKNQQPDSKTGKPKAMGDDLARKIEHALKEPEGWMDADHNLTESGVPNNAQDQHVITDSLNQPSLKNGSGPATSPGRPTEKLTGGRHSVSARPIVAWDREEELGDEYVLIPRLDVKFSAGNGKIVWHVDEKGQKQAFRRSWCQRLGINPEHAATIVNEGQSMEPRLIDGDSLVVDYKATRIIDGKVYALAYRGELFIKRLFKMPSGGLRVQSDNPDKVRYPDMNLSSDDTEHVEIIARVMGVSGAV
jgi:phage repressor protein C with HTH and peptisase S24 domain